MSNTVSSKKTVASSSTNNNDGFGLFNNFIDKAKELKVCITIILALSLHYPCIILTLSLHYPFIILTLLILILILRI